MSILHKREAKILISIPTKLICRFAVALTVVSISIFRTVMWEMS